MKTLVLITLAISLIGCETQADRDRQRNAQTQFQTTMQETVNDATDRLHVTQVDYVNNTQGEQAGDALAECFGHGFDLPRRINVDGQPRPMEGLSNRKIANCDHIMTIMQKQQAVAAAEEKRKDDAYDKAHPH